MYRSPEAGDEHRQQRQLHVEQAEDTTIGALFENRECALTSFKKFLLPLTTSCYECQWEVDRKLRHVEKVVGGKVVQRIRALRRGGVPHVSPEDTASLRSGRSLRAGR